MEKNHYLCTQNYKNNNKIMAKLVRMYFSTFVDVELDENDFSSDEEMIEYAEGNASDYISAQDLYDNLALQPMESEVISEEDLY